MCFSEGSNEPSEPQKRALAIMCIRRRLTAGCAEPNGRDAAVDSTALSAIMTSTISKAEALAFIFACTFNIPCVMALSTTYRESHSLRWTGRVALFYFVCALLLSCVVYHVARLFLN